MKLGEVVVPSTHVYYNFTKIHEKQKKFYKYLAHLTDESSVKS